MNKYWFKPKKYGYGAYPITWEGWMTILIFLILAVLIATYLIHDQILFFSSMGVLISLIIIISYIKTKEEWKWRWGNK